ncbi:Single-stranded nucleic acid binding R3H protein [Rhynchospora pubera]|uniref:Single-stranded nucleic acid binding R3H protein n=1 Tax=Rhynchospora pubera TaxID=906938 RepID=A0AAV8E6Z3_9POAL|nr:Single-stranded nucleic acid binding R3H protein [Rhynchospora pubera]KAJ4803655.1 Single-stranded nucleic acid binding R3H protein [Rhynchospora pubera]
MASIDGPLPCAMADDEKPAVDPFLVELLENPRYRLIVLRMELDIQKFMQNPDLQEFEFQHFPTSYLRCAAHRVAQHYGLETTVADSIVNSSLVNKVIARKTPTSKFPPLLLSKIPPKQSEGESSEKYKIVLRQRPKALTGDAMGTEAKKDLMKSIEEREEEYDKARARIFSGSSNAVEKKVLLPSTQVTTQEVDRNGSKVAMFRDREKDRYDPDYDRSYERYVRGPLPAHNFPVVSQPQYMPFVGNQAGINYGASDPNMSSFSAFGSHQTSNAFYSPWPTPAMMYANIYGNLTHAVPQVPFYQGFDHPRYG